MASFFHSILLMAGLLAVWLPHTASGEEWQVLGNCRLLPNESNDGDSFHVEHEGKEHIFRLYFVDAPETSEQIPSRVSAQATAFGVSRERVLEAGKEAAAFTADKLRRPFTVRTRWQDAEGMSRLPRNFAFVETAGGDDLAELLLAAGYARSFGVEASLPGHNASALRGRYDRLAAKAERGRFGAWGKRASGESVDLGDDVSANSKQGEDAPLGEVEGMPSIDALTEMLRVEEAPVPSEAVGP